jgi:hypothetical protein
MKMILMAKWIIIILSIITFFVIIGIIASCVGTKGTKNNKTLAQIELDLLMFQIVHKIINLETLSDKEYIDIGRRFAVLINAIGKIKSEKEHYFRNYFSRAPKTLDEMVKIILEEESNIFEWKLLPWTNMAFHMYGKDGEYNLKFISADGHFEAVYNRDGILLTQDNNPLNMGTFNYAHQLADQMTHYNLDVWPYFMWNNTKEAMEINKTEEIKSVPIDKNEDAMKRYKEYETLLNKN